MAKFDTPVQVKRGDDVREAGTPAQLNQLLWDGFERTDEAPLVTEEQAADMSPQQKAAVTRKRNETSTVGTAASGGTAEGEKTVGSNPS